MKIALYKLYAILGIPALFVHELFHIIALFLTNTRFIGLKSKWNGTVFNMYVLKGLSSNHFKEIFISLSPILIYVILGVLSFFSITAIYVLAYFVLFPVFPSKGDWVNAWFYKEKIRKYKEFKLEN